MGGNKSSRNRQPPPQPTVEYGGGAGPYGGQPGPYGGQPAPYGAQPAPYGGQPAPYGAPPPGSYGTPAPGPYGAAPAPAPAVHDGHARLHCRVRYSGYAAVTVMPLALLLLPTQL
eukprot:GFYU01033291.1.p3 GENE.GFYU01033291.1~~GFYU01033291.1.p3  ORF type:complete len:115 (+),score=2.40 GFYU01033291.1:48-392(+)